jgi:hypothetical protein
MPEAQSLRYTNKSVSSPIEPMPLRPLSDGDFRKARNFFICSSRK